MRVWLLSIFIASSGILFAQNAPHEKSSHSALKTFTSPDGSFQFTYPTMLTRCELRSQNGNEYAWVQPECSSYHPVCGDLPNPKEPTVCIAYPRNRYSSGDEFEAAAFSASMAQSSEKDCLVEEIRKGKRVRINGFEFYRVEEADGGMSQMRQSTGYVTFRRGVCYSMGITVATTSAIDPPNRPMTKRDWNEIYGKLNQARNSFRFLK